MEHGMAGYSHIGECGVRDPFPVKNPLNGHYYLITTDLRIEKGEGWQAARYVFIYGT